MNWKLTRLMEHMMPDDECEDYRIFVPHPGQVIMAVYEEKAFGLDNTRRRHVEQFQINSEGDYVVTCEDDHDDPINDVTDVKFEVHEAVIVIG